MKKILFVLAFALVSVTASAQTTATAMWKQSETPAVAATFTFSMQIDTGPEVNLPFTCVAATAPATGSVCSAPFPVTTVNLSHTYTVKVCAGAMCQASSITGNTPGTGGLTIKVTVTTIGG